MAFADSGSFGHAASAMSSSRAVVVVVEVAVVGVGLVGDGLVRVAVACGRRDAVVPFAGRDDGEDVDGLRLEEDEDGGVDDVGVVDEEVEDVGVVDRAPPPLLRGARARGAA